MLSAYFRKHVSSQLSYLPDSYSIMCSTEDTGTSVIAVADALSRNGRGKSILVTFNRTYRNIAKDFRENGIDTKRFTIVACSDVSGVKEKSDNCIVMRDPSSLNDVSLLISRLCRQRRFRYLMLDSVDSLLYYNKESSARRFLQMLVNAVKEYRLSGVFVATQNNFSKSIVDFAASMCDGSITLKRNKAAERFVDAFS